MRKQDLFCYSSKVHVHIHVSASKSKMFLSVFKCKIFEPVPEISNNVVCATSKASDQPAHTHSLIRAFASRLSIL